jgi:hypothetical protein
LKTPSASSQRPRWTPFEKAQQVTEDSTDEVGQIYQNSLYTVIVSVNREHSMAKLSIRRNDRGAVHDWRDLQRIKNELVGPECEGFELYPAESRLVDTANQFFLWVFLDQTFRISVGFRERLVADSAGRQTKARQRPFRPDERPPDARSGEQMDFLAEHGVAPGVGSGKEPVA